MTTYSTRESSIVRYALQRQVEERPDEHFVRFDTGVEWTYGQAWTAVGATASALRERGVTQGQRVGLYVSHPEAYLRAWWAVNALGATVVPLNPALRGATLAHPLGVAVPDLVVVEDALTEQYDAAGAAAPRCRVEDLLDGTGAMPELDRPIEPWEVHSIVFTSGTTGPAKGSLMTHIQLMATGSWCHDGWKLDSSDVFLINLPLFHTAAQSMMVNSIRTGTKLAVDQVARMTDYWDNVRRTGATIGHLVGSMATFLVGRPEREDDADHPMRYMIASPLPQEVESFMRRFGIEDLLAAYGSTESPGPLVRTPDVPLLPGSVGRPREGFECRLVDEYDMEVPVGAVGELVVRTDEPWLQTAGYVGDPAATAKAWRNGWLRTGDLMVRDAEGNHFFHDRKTDSLRRRGENISSAEVERDVLSLSEIKEVACVGVPSDTEGEHELKVLLVGGEDEVLDFESIIERLADLMPYFMIPRYYQQVPELPKTPTGKIMKKILRQDGVSTGTWDSQAHGYRFTRKGLLRDQPGG